MKPVINFTVSGIKPIVAGHFEILFRDVLNKQFDKINGRNSFLYKGIIFVFVVMKSYIFAIIGINSGKCNDRAPQITADIFDNGIRVTEIGFGINIKTILIFFVDFRFSSFERGTKVFFEFVQKNSLERFSQIGVIKIFDITPESIVRISAFSEKAVDVRIPFERTSESMEDADESWNKVSGFVEGMEKLLNDIRNSLEETVKQGTVFEEELSQGLINGKDEMPVCALNEFKGHGSRPVVRIFYTTGRTKFGMASERDKF